MPRTTATATPPPRQRKKAVRFCRLTKTSGGPALVIRQQQGNQAVQVDAYFLEPIVCQLGGRGLLLHKHDGTSYSVRLDGTDSECDCPGFEKHGWHDDAHGEPTACKHVMALLKLQSLGKL